MYEQLQTGKGSLMKLVSDRYHLARELNSNGALQMQAFSAVVGNAAALQTIQMMNITSKYDPHNDKVRNNAVTLDTDDYSFDELVDILLHKRNQEYKGTMEYKALAGLLANYKDNPVDNQDLWMGYLEREPKKMDEISGVFKQHRIENCLKEVAEQYLNRLEMLVRDTTRERPEEGFPLRQYDTAKKINGSKGFELLKAVSMRARRAEEEKKRMEKCLELYRRGTYFIQLACYFYTEIPVLRELENIRMEYLMGLAERRRDIDSALDQGTLSDAYINRMLFEIVEDVEKVYTIVTGGGLSSMPGTFRETLSPAYQEQIALVQKRIQFALAPYAALIQSVYPGAKLKYRGSLADGIKNFTKSVPPLKIDIETELDFGKKAIPVDLSAFDIDAFIEFPDSLWKRWEEAKLIPERKKQSIKGKIIMSDWVQELSRMGDNPLAQETIPKIGELIDIERCIREELIFLAGYKQREVSEDGRREADFDMVLQPEKKTRDAQIYGKLYPLGELSRGGSAYQELRSELIRIRETGIDTEGVKLPEPNVEITVPEDMNRDTAVDLISNPLRTERLVDARDMGDNDLEQLVKLIAAGGLPFLEEIWGGDLTEEQKVQIGQALPVVFR